MNNPKQIGFYNNPETLGLVECLRINTEAFLRALELIKMENSINEKQLGGIKERLQRQIEYVERLEKPFDKEKDNGEKTKTV